MSDAVTNNVQFQLRKKQREEMRPSLSRVEVLPSWTTRLPAGYPVTADFDQLLEELPTMRTLTDAAAKEDYLHQLTAELAKIYYYRLRIVQLSDKLTDQQKPIEQKKLLSECSETLAKLKGWLNEASNTNGSASAN